MYEVWLLLVMNTDVCSHMTRQAKNAVRPKVSKLILLVDLIAVCFLFHLLKYFFEIWLVSTSRGPVANDENIWPINDCNNPDNFIVLSETAVTD